LNRQNTTVAARLRQGERAKIFAHDVRTSPFGGAHRAWRFGGSNIFLYRFTILKHSYSLKISQISSDRQAK
jgi:hypothetical protein